MEKNLSDIMSSCDVLTNEYVKAMTDCIGYNSMGTMNWVVDMLETLKARITLGVKIKYEKTGKYFTESSFKDFVYENFCDCIAKSVFKEKVLKGKVYFDIKNTPAGLGLVYTGKDKNKLMRWLADIDDEYSLVVCVPTKVVYMRNNEKKTLTPFMSENFKGYVYDEEDGKIKEIGLE